MDHPFQKTFDDLPCLTKIQGGAPTKLVVRTMYIPKPMYSCRYSILKHTTYTDAIISLLQACF